MSGRMEIAALHARTAEFRRKVEQAERIVGEWVEAAGPVAVAFSGGKDSTALLHLVRQRQPEAPAVFADDEWHLPETEALLAETPGLVRIVRRLYHCEWFTAWVDVDGPEGGSKNRWALENDYAGMGIGLRADENARRRTHLRALGTCFRTKQGLWQCYPLAWWSWRDVWAYIVSRDVPYNRAYDVLERIGVEPERQRIGPFATERALGYGQLAILKRGWPALFNEFAERYPHARAYV